MAQMSKRQRKSFTSEDPFQTGVDSSAEEDFIESAVRLYTDYQTWKDAVDVGRFTLNNRMRFMSIEKIVVQNIDNAIMNMKDLRNYNLMGKSAWSEHLRTQDIKSRRIFEKNQNKKEKPNLGK